MNNMYVTFYKTKPQQQLSFNDLFDNFGTTNLNIIENPESSFPRKLTIWNPEFNYEQQPVRAMKDSVLRIMTPVYNTYAKFKEKPEDMYETFYIPKHSGGMRRIDAPNNELKETLRNIKHLFEYDLRFLAHDRAFAYVKQRSSKEALMEHQQNESKWFLKLDIKDFFPNCSKELILQTMTKVFPFNLLLNSPAYFQSLLVIVELCMLNNGLPQGTPMSPTLTNLIMVPYDFELYKTFNDFEKQHFIYTRYADDILLSSKYDFDKEKVFNKVQEIIEPFKLKTEKTRYGSSAGRNWNLGLMLNKDNQITIGYKRKQRFKAAMFNFLKDFTEGRRWDRIDVEVLLGEYAYYKKIEPEYINYIAEKYGIKFNNDFKEAMRTILKS
jgi:hypothetical protein